MSIEILEFPLYSKNKSYHVRKNHLWDKLSKEQKYDLINKYINTIEVSKVKEEIIIKKILIVRN